MPTFSLRNMNNQLFALVTDSGANDAEIAQSIIKYLKSAEGNFNVNHRTKIVQGFEQNRESPIRTAIILDLPMCFQIFLTFGGGYDQFSIYKRSNLHSHDEIRALMDGKVHFASHLELCVMPKTEQQINALCRILCEENSSQQTKAMKIRLQLVNIIQSFPASISETDRLTKLIEIIEAFGNEHSPLRLSISRNLELAYDEFINFTLTPMANSTLFVTPCIFTPRYCYCNHSIQEIRQLMKNRPAFESRIDVLYTPRPSPDRIYIPHTPRPGPVGRAAFETRIDILDAPRQGPVGSTALSASPFTGFGSFANAKSQYDIGIFSSLPNSQDSSSSTGCLGSPAPNTISEAYFRDLQELELSESADIMGKVPKERSLAKKFLK